MKRNQNFKIIFLGFFLKKHGLADEENDQKLVVVQNKLIDRFGLLRVLTFENVKNTRRALELMELLGGE